MLGALAPATSPWTGRKEKVVMLDANILVLKACKTARRLLLPRSTQMVF